MELIIEKQKAQGSQKLEQLILISNRLVGKTASLAQLPNCLIIDLEGHTKAFATKGNVFNVKDNLLAINEERKKNGSNPEESKPIGPVSVLKMLARQLENSTKYDFIVWDTLTTLEVIAMPLAVQMFKKTPEGQSYTGSNVITDLGYGKGYGFMRNAVEEIIKPFMNLAAECQIFAGHVTTKNKVVGDKEVEITDIDLSTQVRKIFVGNSSATGYIYRNATGLQNTISFVNKGDTMVLGARQAHLDNREFLFSEKLNEQGELSNEGKLVTYWENIFPDYFKKLTQQNKPKENGKQVNNLKTTKTN